LPPLSPYFTGDKLPVNDDRYSRVVGLISERGTREGLARILATALDESVKAGA